jgi:hypothetical protein
MTEEKVKQKVCELCDGLHYVLVPGNKALKELCSCVKKKNKD